MGSRTTPDFLASPSRTGMPLPEMGRLWERQVAASGGSGKN